MTIGAPFAATTKVITKANIAQRVIDAILARKLPPGERLGEQDLADLFGVSRTLVREALMQLRARGFVEVRSRFGWYVVEPSFEEARETYAARRVIEPGMLRDAGQPLQSAIRRLRKHVADERQSIVDGDAGARSVLLADFHVCLADCLGNRFLTAMVIDLSARTTLVSALYQSTREAQVSNHDHEAIVDALAIGDSALAERLMRAHIDALAGRLDATLDKSASPQDRLRDMLGAATGVSAATRKPPRKRAAPKPVSG